MPTTNAIDLLFRPYRPTNHIPDFMPQLATFIGFMSLFYIAVYQMLHASQSLSIISAITSILSFASALLIQQDYRKAGVALFYYGGTAAITAFAAALAPVSDVSGLLLVEVAQAAVVSLYFKNRLLRWLPIALPALCYGFLHAVNFHDMLPPPIPVEIARPMGYATIIVVTIIFGASTLRGAERYVALQAHLTAKQQEIARKGVQLRQFIEGIPLPVTAYTPDFEVQFNNRASREWIAAFKLNPDELTQMNMESLKIYYQGTNDLYPFEKLPVVQALRCEQVYADDVELELPNGLRVPIEVNAAPILDDNGLVEYIVSVVRDLRERRTHEKAMREQEAQMIQTSKLASLGEMAAGIAHEINNPMTVIEACAWRIQKLSEDPSLREFRALSENMIQGCQRITKIIRGMRVFARDGAQDTLEVVSVSTLITDAAELCRPRFGSSGISLHVNTTPAFDAVVKVNPVQIVQVMVNIIQNAADAAACSPDEKRVDVQCQSDQRQVYIRISDTGPGMDAHLESRIFEPFFTTKPPGKGTGLGLSISKGILTTHNGSLTVESRHAPTTFLITLPLAQV